MVFMAVRNHKASHFVNLRLNIRNIRNNEIDSEHISRRKCQSAVDDNHIFIGLDSRNVHPDLIQTAERNNLHRPAKCILILLRFIFIFLYLYCIGEQRKVLKIVLSAISLRTCRSFLLCRDSIRTTCTMRRAIHANLFRVLFSLLRSIIVFTVRHRASPLIRLSADFSLLGRAAFLFFSATHLIPMNIHNSMRRIRFTFRLFYFFVHKFPFSISYRSIVISSPSRIFAKISITDSASSPSAKT